MNSRNKLALASLALVGAFAIGQDLLPSIRPLAPTLTSSATIVVSSQADAGPGTLREAIFAAAGAAERKDIQLPEGRITLRTPLPPLVNANGIVIRGVPGQSEIDAEGLSSGPVIDVDSPTSLISGVTILNASEQAILARKDSLGVVDTTIVACDLGVYIAEGVSEVLITGSTFQGNRVGIWLGADSGGIEIRNSTFEGHGDSAVWAVRDKPPVRAGNHQLLMAANRFQGDRISVVLANIPTLVEDNEFVEAQDAALFLIGEGAIVQRNRIRRGNAAGILMDDALGTLIDSNEVDHNGTLGILVRSSARTIVQRNRLYGNGYGVGFVLGDLTMPNTAAENRLLRQQFDGVIVIGESPVLRDNLVLNSKLAGFRVLDFMSASENRTPSEPFFEGNVLSGNQFDQTMRGDYRVSAPGEPSHKQIRD